MWFYYNILEDNIFLSRIKRGVVKKHFNLVFKPTIQTLLFKNMTNMRIIQCLFVRKFFVNKHIFISIYRLQNHLLSPKKQLK